MIALFFVVVVVAPSLMYSDFVFLIGVVIVVEILKSARS